MVPLLDDLARESAQAGGTHLAGVRAIMLYPLNALIASQKDRLDRWTRPFGGRIRYGLYNSLMQPGRTEDLRKARSEAPQETRFRNDLYRNPPPILVTNNTMLEFMTIRQQDRPILEASAGKLRWIIVDEAHSYIGSTAAELSLLLRRVLQAFEVSAEDVRFVATSATIGSNNDESRSALQRFWADIAGVSTQQVDVIFGEREPFRFPVEGGAEAELISAALPNIAERDRHGAAKELAENLRSAPMSLTDVHTACGGDSTQVLHAFAEAESSKPILPMRIHKFIRAIPGLWSCANPNCTGERPDGWPFGALFFERELKCPHCNSIAFEVQSCSTCGEAMLLAHEQDGKVTAADLQKPTDEFSFEASSEGLPAEDEDQTNEQGRGFEVMIAGRAVEGARQHGIDYVSGELSDRSAEDGIWIGQYVDEPCLFCGNKGGAGWNPFTSWRFGMPFLAQNAVPVVIDGVSPVSKPHDRPLPNDGRQVISFTDSRQGTARTAARIETQSERNFVRAFVYHSVQQAGALPHEGPDKSALEGQLEQMRAVGMTSGPAWEWAEKQLEQATQDPIGRLGWDAVVDQLSRSPILEHTIQQVWDQDRGTQFTGDPRRLAHFLLLRELGRRPLNANTIETMGLARLSFPAIERQTEANLPSAFRRASKSLTEWKDYLYYVIDQLRGAFALRMNREEEHWLPGGAYAAPIIRTEEERVGRRDFLWPSAKGHGNEKNAVKALSLGLQLDPTEPGDRDLLNDTLATAWNALRSLLSGGDSYALDLTLSDIEQVHEAWLCPLSRRLVPRLVFGHSPNAVGLTVPGEGPKPKPVKMPTLPQSFPRTDAAKADLRRFGETDEQIRSLRSEGVWTAIHDRMLINAPFVRAEEHSAQQPAWRLRDFEAQFKRGEINMLACSTTMEMGVDIGSIEAVVNTNVPPSIANYRQRVGRAGRRRQGYAFSLTIARDTPLDRETLQDPKGYLLRELRAPKVTLDSRPIVQRHANALLLAAWLAESGGQLNRIEAGDFFGCRADLSSLPADEQSPCSDFVAWLKLPNKRLEMQPKLDRLVKGTILESDMQIFDACAEAFADQAEKFSAIWDRFREQIKEVQPEAQGAIKHQATRVCREYLLKELANRALIPGSGFPTAVVPFVNDCRFSKSRGEQKDGQEQSARAKRYDYPTRNADIAIREYAPGAEVVVDGLVWKSAGVALNWKRPIDDADARETQSFKRLWACSRCGEHGTTFGRITQCRACGTNIADDLEYLEPTGFRVDWLAVPNADTDHAEYIEPEDPLISASESDWQPLLDPSAGRYRSSPIGTVFHYSNGPGRNRYDLCLDCGRAAPHRLDGTDPLSKHDALTPMKGQAGRCSGNDRSFAIKRGIALGFEVQTDVAELQLTGFSKQGAALALGSALREVLSRQLGIEVRALGLGVRRSVGALATTIWSVLLYDQASGGAGYSPRLFDDIPALLRETRAVLDCARNCETGCSSCVLAADLFSKQDMLDRREALSALNPILAIIAEPEENDRAFADAKLSRGVADELVMRMARLDRFVIPISSPFDLSAMYQEPFRTLFQHAERYNTPRALLLSQSLLGGADEAFLRGLQRLGHRFELELFAGEVEAATNEALPIALAESGDQTTTWFSRDTLATIPSPRWGLGGNHAIVKTCLVNLHGEEEIAASHFDFSKGPSGAVEVVEAKQGCSAASFGNFFVENHLRKMLEGLEVWRPGKLIRIVYSDRYLKAPLPMLCALRTFGALHERLSSNSGPTKVRLLCDQAFNAREPRQIFHNWETSAEQDEVAENLAAALGLELQIADEQAEHARHLELHFSSGEAVSIYLDQGFGQWRLSGNTHFNFHQRPEQQAQALLALKAYIGCESDSYIAATIR